SPRLVTLVTPADVSWILGGDEVTMKLIGLGETLSSSASALTEGRSARCGQRGTRGGRRNEAGRPGRPESPGATSRRPRVVRRNGPRPRAPDGSGLSRDNRRVRAGSRAGVGDPVGRGAGVCDPLRGYHQRGGGCYQGQCSRMPAAAPAATRYGSLIFHLRSSARLTAAMAAAAQEWMV